MKRYVLSFLSSLFLAMLTACASVPSPGIEPGDVKAYTFTTTEKKKTLTGTVLVTVGKEVKWCHVEAQKCVTEFTHPVVASYMFHTSETYRLTPREQGTTTYYHGDVGKTHVWNVMSEKGLLGSCGVTLTQNGTERHYEEKCQFGGATIDARTAVGRDELLWMSGRLMSRRGIRDFTLTSARYSS